jgi:hypothetical protein
MKRISKVILITLLTAVMAMGVCGCSTVLNNHQIQDHVPRNLAP